MIVSLVVADSQIAQRGVLPDKGDELIGKVSRSGISGTQKHLFEASIDRQRPQDQDANGALPQAKLLQGAVPAFEHLRK